jgi:hypothetical protein
MSASLDPRLAIRSDVELVFAWLSIVTQYLLHRAPLTIPLPPKFTYSIIITRFGSGRSKQYPTKLHPRFFEFWQPSIWVPANFFSNDDQPIVKSDRLPDGVPTEIAI